MNNIQDVLKIWEEEERQVREHLASAGSVHPSELIERTGMDFFNDMFAGKLPSPPIGETLNFIPLHMEKGSAVFQGRPLYQHYNPLGTVHGGWLCTLLNSAVGCAVQSTLPQGKAFTTLEIKVNMVRALTVDVPIVRAEGKVVHSGHQVSTAEGRIVGPDGKIYAHATTTCLIFDVRP